jgi:riboflavin synthase
VSRIGVVDTTFSRVDVGQAALEELADLDPDHDVTRRTVPGVKDLPAACRALLDDGADLVMALGMVGPEDVDKTCGHEASMGLMALRVLFGRPVIEVFVHMDEVDTDEALRDLARERTREHAVNAHRLLEDPEALEELAGTGQREGFEDAGPVGDAMGV